MSAAMVTQPSAVTHTSAVDEARQTVRAALAVREARSSAPPLTPLERALLAYFDAGEAGRVHKACGCGRAWTREAWEALPVKHEANYGDGIVLRARDCACGSTLSDFVDPSDTTPAPPPACMECSEYDLGGTPR